MNKHLKKTVLKIRALTIVPFYFYYKLFQSRRSNGKAILINRKANPFGRYLFLLVKFFHLEGYTVYMTGDFKFFFDIRKDKHAAYIFSERLIEIGRPPKGASFILLNEEKLSLDYFSFLNQTKSDEQSFYVPMAQHPIMYHLGWWNTVLEKVKRKRSLFMAGNFNEIHYSRDENEKLFSVQNRLKLYAHLNEKNLLFAVNNFVDVKHFLENDADNKIVLVNSLKSGGVPMDLLRQTLSSFDFFFALPGVIMPFSHNIIEAMSAGCIPFIQASYARLFKPALCNGIQAVTFNDISDMEERISYLFKLTEQEVEMIRNEVISYYNNYLTPEKVVNNIEKNNFTTIYLQAEGGSVALLKKNNLTIAMA